VKFTASRVGVDCPSRAEILFSDLSGRNFSERRLAKIRISDLAKELGIPSKMLVERLGTEGFSDQYNKPSQGIPIGLAETVREWFPASAGNDAGADAAGDSATATLTKPKAPPKKKSTKSKSSTDDSGESSGDSTPSLDESTPVMVEIEVARTGEPTAVVADPSSVASPVHTPQTPAGTGSASTSPATNPTNTNGHHAASPAAEAVSDEVRSPQIVPTTVPVPSIAGESTSNTNASGAAALTPTTQQPTQSAPTISAVALNKPLRPSVSLASSGGSHRDGGRDGHRGVGVPATPMRPTISLDNPNRAPVSPAPQLVTPEKTVMKGPRLVREEKPDLVPTPRPRTRTDGPPGTSRPAGVGTPLNRGGTGVKRVVGPDAPPGEETEEAKKKKASAAGTRRRDLDGRRGEAEAKLREFTEADLIERADRLRSAAVYRSGMDTHLRKSGRAGQGQSAKTAAQVGEPIEIEEPITVRTLSASLGIKSTDIIARLMKQKIFATVNQSLDIETAQMIGLEFGVEISVLKAPTLEEQLASEFTSVADTAPESLHHRPPVVTILGHVDHGKTSLLDRIRSANVAAGEAGGITQHIAAFSVEIKRAGAMKRVTFIDTPGHQAFTAMRARGANMTDVVVLVIDAAQGIQPQTVESINHARAANVPIVVAMNKIDLPDASPDKILGQLAANDLNPVEWGGQVEVVRTSARTGVGIEDLIEILDLQAEILELKADPTGNARGIVVEARVDPGLGSVATVLVQNGTLKLGDVILAGAGFGRIRQLMDSYGKPIKSAGPSTPVLVSGFGQIPSAGDKFFVVDDLDRAREISAERTQVARQVDLANSNRVSLDNLFAASREGKIKTINLIVKADVQGSVETLQKTITDQNTDEVRVKLIHSAVGPINESDVELATASDAVIIGFHVVPDEKAQSLAEVRHVEIRTYRVIYEIFDDLKKAMSGMLEPEVREKHHGWIDIREVFKVSKVGNVAGCYVTEGHVSRGSKIRLVRDGAVITEGLTIDTLRRIKEDVKEVKTNFECGIKLANYDDIKKGDKLQAYIREEFKRTL